MQEKLTIRHFWIAIEISRALGVPAKQLAEELRQKGVNYSSDEALYNALRAARAKPWPQSQDLCWKDIVTRHRPLTLYVWTNRSELARALTTRRAVDLAHTILATHASAIGMPAPAELTERQFRKFVRDLKRWFARLTNEKYQADLVALIASASKCRISALNLIDPATLKDDDANSKASVPAKPSVVSHGVSSANVQSKSREEELLLAFRKNPLQLQLGSVDTPEEFKRLAMEIVGIEESQLNHAATDREVDLLINTLPKKDSARRAIGWIPGIRDTATKRALLRLVKGIAQYKCKVL